MHIPLWTSKRLTTCQLQCLKPNQCFARTRLQSVQSIILQPLDYSRGWTSCNRGKLQQALHKKLEKQLEQQSQSISKPALAVPNPTTFWEQMPAYYSSSRRWKFNDEMTRMYDGLPLNWTMMHPSSTTWNQTHAWNQPLDKYIPWIACQTLSSKPVLLSYSMWNSWQHSDPMAATLTRQPTAMTRASTLYPDTTNQQKVKSQTNSTDWSYKHHCILISDSQPPAL